MAVSTSAGLDDELIRAVFDNITLPDVKFTNENYEPQNFNNDYQSSREIIIPSPSPRFKVNPVTNDINKNTCESNVIIDVNENIQSDNNDTCQQHQQDRNDAHIASDDDSHDSYWKSLSVENPLGDINEDVSIDNSQHLSHASNPETKIHVKYYPLEHEKIENEKLDNGLSSDQNQNVKSSTQNEILECTVSLSDEGRTPPIILIPTSKAEAGEMLTNGSDSSNDGCVNTPAEFSPRSLDSENSTETTTSPDIDSISSPKTLDEQLVSISVVEVNDFKPSLSYSSFEPEKHELILREIGKVPKVSDIMHRFQKSILQEDEKKKNALHTLPKRGAANGKENYLSQVNELPNLTSKKLVTSSLSGSFPKVHIQLPHLDITSVDGKERNAEKSPIIKTPHPNAWTRRTSPLLRSETNIDSQETNSPVEEKQRPVSEILEQFVAKTGSITAQNLSSNRSSIISDNNYVKNNAILQADSVVYSKNLTQPELKENRPKTLSLVNINVWQNDIDENTQNNACDDVKNQNSRNVNENVAEEEKPLYQTYWGVGGTLKDHRSSTNESRPVGSSSAIIRLRSVPVSPTVYNLASIAQNGKSSELQNKVLGLRKVRDFYNVWGRVNADANK